jgi:hypothetical protein
MLTLAQQLNTIKLPGGAAIRLLHFSKKYLSLSLRCMAAVWSRVRRGDFLVTNSVDRILRVLETKNYTVTADFQDPINRVNYNKSLSLRLCVRC